MGFLSQWKHYLDDVEAGQLNRGRALDMEKLEKVRPSTRFGSLYLSTCRPSMTRDGGALLRTSTFCCLSADSASAPAACVPGFILAVE